MTELKTRKPTGRPSWPIVLLAGAEKAGKSYTAAVATSSPLVGRSYWVTIGEDEPDEYGPLGRFEIVEHDGQYRSILDTLKLVAQQPPPPAGVPLLVVDSMTRLWNLLTDEAQDHANARAAAKARKYNKPVPDEEAPISMDLWNEAKGKWVAVMDAIRGFPGPVILTARLDEVTVLDDNGRPTTQRRAKVQAEKSLAYDVGALIEMPARGETWISGVRSIRLQLAERTKAPDEFSIDWFWRRLGLGEVETGPRDHNGPKATAHAPTVAPAGAAGRPPAFDPGPWEDQIALAQSVARLRHVYDEAAQQGFLKMRLSNGEAMEAVLWRTKTRLEQDARAHAVEPPPEPEDTAADQAYAYEGETPF